MKSIFLKICLIFFFASAGLIYAQVHYVYLDEDEANLVVPGSFSVVVPEGDSIIFVSKNGEFQILIREAYEILDVREDELSFYVSTSSSPAYVVRSGIDDSITKEYLVFSIGTLEWPEAPPRIIIVHK